MYFFDVDGDLYFQSPSLLDFAVSFDPDFPRWPVALCLFRTHVKYQPMQALTKPNLTEQHVDTFPIKGTDHIEFYVGNAKQAAHFYMSAFGFEMIAYRGPETGHRATASYVLKQGKIVFVLTSAFHPNHEIAQHVQRHGDGVKVLALWVDNVEEAYHLALERGAVSAFPVQLSKDEHGQVKMAAIRTYGETIHTLVEREHYQGVFLPGFVPKSNALEIHPIGLKYVDHCVGNVDLGDMNRWVKFYEDVLGFNLLVTFDDKTSPPITPR
jgi:4-hydroxyphenylpyruvate dioxygenase